MGQENSMKMGMDNDWGLLKKRIAELEKENSLLRKQHVEINEAKELYLKIFEEFPALIWRSRLDKLCDYFNKTWLDFTGRTMEQEFGNGWAEGVHPDDFDTCLQTYVNAFDKQEPFLMVYRLKDKFGEYRWIRDFGRPFYDLDNTFLGYIGSCYDITEIKTNEERLIELNSTKDKFFSILAHDLKGPFSSVVSISEILIEKVQEKDYEGIEKNLGLILQSSNQTMELLSNLMVWAQSQSDKIVFTPEKIEMYSIVHRIMLLFQSWAQQKNITLTNLLSKILVNADKQMVNTVLRNLISNAIKFTKPGGTVTISAMKDEKELLVSVRDNGIGIPQDKIDKLFKVSETSSTLGTQKEKGTGLGLVLCNEFVKKNNGKIWAESQESIGTTFYFTLPLVQLNPSLLHP